ncbi:MAG: hypothetical protein HUU43_15865, partial [Ignavibacteriaceae bacterium]|nr:hypothetical protein [Ignavibacteriaceae bacterium]
MNMNNDFELTSENQNPERKHSTGDNARIRIKEITRSGNLRIPGDDIWPYWKLIKSDNYFERLFLDIEQHDKITNETVTNHYTEISGYLEKWRERESAGINFSDSHGGYSLKEIRENLDEAFELLRHKSSRESYTDQHFAKVRSDRAKLLIPVIKTALADKVLTTEEKQLVFEEGNKIGMSVDEILELLTKIINETGDIRDESSNSNGGEVLSFYDAVSIIGADTSKTFDQAKKRYLKLRDEQIADLSSSSTEERNAARVKLQQLDEAFSVLTKNSHKFRQKNEGASDVTRTSSAQTDLSTPRVSSSREASSVNYDTRKTGRNYTPLFLILGFFVVGLIFIISTTNKSKDFSSGTPANDNSTVSSETQTYQGANRNSGGNNNNKPETDKSDNSGSVSQPETNTDTPPIDG